jgi:hypothetical protein
MSVGYVESLVGEGASFLGCQAFLWRSHCPYRSTCHDYQAGAQSPWTDVAWSNHPMWGSVEFTPSLSGGVKAHKAVGLAMVEKVRVPRGDRVVHAS